MNKTTLIETLHRWIAKRPGLDPRDYIRGWDFSGRLTITPQNDGDGFSIDYCVGQYWPTEYRRAVCAVLASAIWNRLREDLPPEIENRGDAIRKNARRELGRTLAARWFN